MPEESLPFAPDKVKVLEDANLLIDKIDDIQYELRDFETKEFLCRIFLDQAGIIKLIDELHNHLTDGKNRSLPALIQFKNVAALPTIIKPAIALPDVHTGYGFAIGNVAAFDASDENCIVVPGGVGYDINCGVRLLASKFSYQEVVSKLDELTKAIGESVPLGAGVVSDIKLSEAELDDILMSGTRWCAKNGYCQQEDLELCEDEGCIDGADPSILSKHARLRGLNSLGTLGSGNHYIEVQKISQIFDPSTARALGIEKEDQVMVMIHCGSRGIGHQVATDFSKLCVKEIQDKGINISDNQLAYTTLNSKLGQEYMSCVAAASNFAYANRCVIAKKVSDAFKAVFEASEESNPLQLVYDVSHNIVKRESFTFQSGDNNIIEKECIVHRKGSTRSYPPNHRFTPDRYKSVGQPVFVGGSMGTSSFIMVGQTGSLLNSFGSTCHGAGRALARSKCNFDEDLLFKQLKEKNISIYHPSGSKLRDEAPQAYKDVKVVVDICHKKGLSKKIAQVLPIGVIKG
ncbi:MAG: hypothetical protein MHMPM18_000398 [Marteilia pararefringens]